MAIREEEEAMKTVVERVAITAAVVLQMLVCFTMRASAEDDIKADSSDRAFILDRIEQIETLIRGEPLTPGVVFQPRSERAYPREVDTKRVRSFFTALGARISACGLREDSEIMEKLKEVERRLTRSAGEGKAVLVPGVGETHRDPAETGREDTPMGSASAPPGDLCTDAVPIVAGKVYTASICGAHSEAYTQCGLSAVADVWFRYAALDDAYVGVRVPYFLSLSVHTGCLPGGSEEIACSQGPVTFRARRGETYLLRVASDFAAGSFEIEVETSGLAGKVLDAPSGHAIDGARIDIWDSDGEFVTIVEADAQGRYAAAGLRAGTYYVSTLVHGYRNELYDKIPFDEPWLSDPTKGTPVEVPADTIVAGIDFGLVRAAARISGTVRDAESGQRLGGTRVVAFDSHRRVAGETRTGADGQYTVRGLAGGTYYILAKNAPGFFPQLYDSIPCEDCDPLDGTPVEVGLSSSRSGIDLSLTRAGSISGRVLDYQGGIIDPYYYLDVEIYDANWRRVAYAEADEEGHYQAGPLASGTYFAYADEFHGDPPNSDYRSQFFRDAQCFYNGCHRSRATPIEVETGRRTDGIDFKLYSLDDPAAGGRIVTAVLDERTGGPIAHPRVLVVDSSGVDPEAAFIEQDGHVIIGGLPPGDYYVGFGADGYRSELYDNLPCRFSECDLTQGTPVHVSLDQATSINDVRLKRAPSISGRVTDERTGDAVADAMIRVHNERWGNAAATRSGPDGTYRIDTEPGIYFVTCEHPFAWSTRLAGEAYEEIPCYWNRCQPEEASPVLVKGEAETPDIDFTLDLGGVIDGRVTDGLTGVPISFATIILYDSDGIRLSSVVADDCGIFEVAGLPPGGTYYAVARAGRHLPQLYSGIPCADADCDPTNGTAISVNSGQVTHKVDFALAPASPRNSDGL